jgi:hypothetical protein
MEFLLEFEVNVPDGTPVTEVKDPATTSPGIIEGSPDSLSTERRTASIHTHRMSTGTRSSWDRLELPRDSWCWTCSN